MLQDKVAVVTGAARGIGKCIVAEFAALGAKPVILDFDEEAGLAFVKELQASGTDAFFFKTDVTSFTDLQNARNAVIKKFGAVDILVINAGISRKLAIGDISVEEWNKVININLNGSFYTIKAFWDDFLAKDGEHPAKIIFISSGSAITGTGGGCHYAASKAGQHGLMRAVARELGPHHVNVNAVAPRVIMTDIFDHLYPTKESRNDLLQKIPIGRFGLPEDVAKLTAFLAGPGSDYVHGQIILLDGGRTY
ncbi:MAG: SDR family oxidoreductase [Treponema sp.]|jgi:3-oxoacyl-[acyl-carrier protein] reductase|nr:SDR family oxidoreductase [Treponema sp.]